MIIKKARKRLLCPNNGDLSSCNLQVKNKTVHGMVHGKVIKLT